MDDEAFDMIAKYGGTGSSIELLKKEKPTAAQLQAVYGHMCMAISSWDSRVAVETAAKYHGVELCLVL